MLKAVQLSKMMIAKLCFMLDCQRHQKTAKGERTIKASKLLMSYSFKTPMEFTLRPQARWRRGVDQLFCRFQLGLITV